jgi:small ligand-binding sensory domain FIST
MPKPPTNATGRAGSDRDPLATVGISDHLDSRTAALEVVERLVGSEEGPGTESFVVVVASFHHRAALGEAVEAIRGGCGAIHALGMTATAVAASDPASADAGPFEPDGEPAGPGLAALRIPIAAGTGDSIVPLRIDLPDGPPEHWSAEAVARRLPGRIDAAPTLFLCDPFTLAAGPLADRLDRINRAGAGTPAPFFGALASGASLAGANTLVLDREASGTGGVGLALGPGFGLDAFVALGGVGVGPELVVTRASGERIEELSGRPAAEAMLEAIGWSPESGGPPAPPLTLLGIAIDAAKPRRGRGDWKLRTVTAIGRDRSITVDEPVRPGRTVRFHRLDAEADATDLALLLDREQLRPPPLAALAWCGTGRPPGEVADLVSRRLGVPALAAATIGEIVPLDGRTFLQRRSIAVGLLRRADARP